MKNIFFTKPTFKNQRSQYAGISLIVLLLSLLEENVQWGDWVYILISIAAVGVFVYQVAKQQEIGLYNILGVAFPLVFSVCVFCTPLFEVLLYAFWGLLFVSLVICMHKCKDEDAKAIALLHVMYMTSCALAIPVWLKI